MKRKKYKNMELTCLGNTIHTGKDVKITLNGKNFIKGCSKKKNHITDIEWEIGPCDWNNGNGIITIRGTKSNIIIDYPIKYIELQFEKLSIESDNTSLNTVFLWDGIVITNELNPCYLRWTAGNSSRINTLDLQVV